MQWQYGLNSASWKVESFMQVRIIAAHELQFVRFTALGVLLTVRATMSTLLLLLLGKLKCKVIPLRTLMFFDSLLRFAHLKFIGGYRARVLPLVILRGIPCLRRFLRIWIFIEVPIFHDYLNIYSC